MMQARDHGKAARSPFGEYAAVYDLIYQDKNYAAEAQFIAKLITRFGGYSPSMTKVLDLACGTGRHACELASLGYQVEGSDISADMVEIARDAIRRCSLPVSIHNQSFQTAHRIGKRFEVVLAMFASLGYLTDEDEFSLACKNVRELLIPEGVFIFDVWNGSAVVRDFSPLKVKRVSGGGLDVERVSRTTVDETTRIADVRFEFAVTRQDGSVWNFDERHLVRFFFPAELDELLDKYGFQVLFRCPFLDEGRELSADDWNMTYVARSRS
jgi:SAM-dependent methyltransferase